MTRGYLEGKFARTMQICSGNYSNFAPSQTLQICLIPSHEGFNALCGCGPPIKLGEVDVPSSAGGCSHPTDSSNLLSTHNYLMATLRGSEGEECVPSHAGWCNHLGKEEISLNTILIILTYLVVFKF